MSRLARNPRSRGPILRPRAVQGAAAIGAAALLLLAGTLPDGAARAQGSSLTTDQLIDLLVQKGVLSRAQVNAVIQNAARGGGAPGRAASGRAARTAPGTTAATAAAPAAAPEPEVAPGTVRVTYVPESTRQEIAAEVKQQVMQEARDNGWAAPNAVPGWTQRVRVSGDVRVRGDSTMFNRGNYNAFPNFNAINALPNGFDVNNQTGLNPPILNNTTDRTRVRLRARLEVTAQVADWIDAGIRIGTGNDNSPVSLNQTLGTPGDFSKYSLWLDRAYVVMRPIEGLKIYAGRAPNPFWTSDLLFDDNVNFDGIAVQYSRPIIDGVSGFVNAGAFPVFNTDFNFGTTNINKTKSRDSYLFALQGGADWKITNTIDTKLAAGYFNFSNVEGKQSSRCFNPVNIGSCDTDNTRPGFVQFGNTMFPLRNVIQDPSNPNGPVPQIFGLASRFDLMDIRGQLTLSHFHPFDIVLAGDYVYNFGFNRSRIVARGPVNNLGSVSGSTDNGPFVGSNSGYSVSLSIGNQLLDKRWEWNASIAYKYLGSDAVLDALTNSDFNAGGTNAKGYILTGNLALAPNAYISARWLSTNQIAGPPRAVDIVQVDLNARF